MEILKYFLLALNLIYAINILTFSSRTNKLFKYIALNSLLGIFLLLLLFYTRKYTGLAIYINLFTVSISSFYGIIGIIGLLFFNLII